ncbi:MAG TPA: hypothetical protein VGI95_08185 [Caulobacteraceae bacterium]|jgi:hypothetical protein
MATSRPTHRRFLIAATVSLIGVGGLATVCAAQDGRDGLTQPASYHGPFLSWSGKTSASAPASAPQTQDDAQPTRYVAPPRPAPQQYTPPAPQPMRLPEPEPLQPAAPAPQATVTLAPAPTARQPVALRPAYAARPAVVTTASATPVPPKPKHAPQQLAVQSAPAPVAPAAAAPSAQTPVHFYSLHREYGMTPDPVATPTDRPMVLIGPADNSSPQSQDDAQDGQKPTGKGAAPGADD